MKCTSATFRNLPARARGFAAVVAIFVLVVLALLGATLVTIFSGQQRESAFDSLGIQAYQAARAGIEFGTYQALRGNCATANTTFQLPGTLSRFWVQVVCLSTSHTEGASTVTMYRITATACNRTTCPSAADGTYVERELRAVAGSSAP